MTALLISSSRGRKSSPVSSTSRSRARKRLSGLGLSSRREIPILLKANLSVLNKLKLAAYIAPCFGFNVYHGSKSEFEGETHEYKSELKNIFEFSLMSGFMIEFDKFVTDIRYSYGITSLSDFDIRNSVFSFLIGMKL